MEVNVVQRLVSESNIDKQDELSSIDSVEVIIAIGMIIYTSKTTVTKSYRVTIVTGNLLNRYKYMI